jgi:hypothetical protein
MTKRIDNPEDLAGVINERKPADVLYDLGKGEKRTELIVTHVDGDSRVSHRVNSDPLIRLYGDNGALSMDITDSNENNDGYSYRNLKPQGATFNNPDYPQYEVGGLEVDLGEGKLLGITHVGKDCDSPR